MKNTIILLIFFVGLTSCGSKKAEEKELNQTVVENKLILTETQTQTIKIEIGKLENKLLSSVIKLNGKIDVPPQNLISVSMPLGGFLKSTQLLPGMRIKKGETIAVMEDQQYIDFQQEYLIAKSKLAFAENEYNRQKDLNQSKATSDKVFQQTEMDLKNQKIIMNSLSEKLKLININPLTLNELNISRSITLSSPIDGFVSKVNVKIGKYVNPTDILFELINPDDIHLNLKVFEKDLDKLSIGQKLFAFNNNQPDKKHPCEIILISQDLGEDRSADVHCHFEDYDKTLFPGMYMNAEIQIKSNNVLAIHEDAIVSFEGKDFVFILAGKNEFEMIEIQKGISDNNFTEITTENKKSLTNLSFVTKGAYSLLMQLKNKSEE